MLACVPGTGPYGPAVVPSWPVLRPTMQPLSVVRYTSTVTMPPDGTSSNTATMGSTRPGSIVPHCLCATFEAES